MWGRVKESREGMEECSNRYSPRHQNVNESTVKGTMYICTKYVMHYRCTYVSCTTDVHTYCILLHLPMVH